MLLGFGDISRSVYTDYQGIAVLTDDAGILVHGQSTGDGQVKERQTPGPVAPDGYKSSVTAESTNMNRMRGETIQVSLEEATALMLAEDEPLR
jgi:primase-polymerase (primpol)-like protein